jgi:acetylglutamate kinase
VTALRVYKVGGPALEDPSLAGPLAAEVRQGQTLIVHGGGRQVGRMLEALSIESRFVDGRRETSAAAMDVVEMVLSGAVNKSLAAALTAAGVPAVGLSGRDAGLIRARLTPELGRVGTPEKVDPRMLRVLLDGGFVPVVSPVSTGPSGEPVNVNADEAALALALALGARALVYLSDVDGVSVEGEALELLTAGDAQRFIEAGAITAGMALKVRAALDASRAGIREVVIAGKSRLMGGFAGTRVVARGGAQP